MELRSLTDERELRRHIDALWLPYQRELADIIDDFDLAEGVDFVDAEVDFRLEQLENGTQELVVAEDDGDWVGFVVTDVDEASDVFEQPNRLVVGDRYVDPDYRGGGLARGLMAHAAARADREECSEVALYVDVPNERAIAFYEKLGFETARKRTRVETDELA